MTKRRNILTYLKHTDPIIYWLLGCAGISVILICLYFNNFGGTGLSQETNVWGTFGDYLGGTVGVLLNFTGAVLIYLTFTSQQRTSNLQQFETTFFNMLSTQRDIVKSIRGKEIKKNPDGPGIVEIEHEGYIFIEIFARHLRVKIDLVAMVSSNDDLQTEISGVYNPMFIDNMASLSHYFRHLFHLVKYVDESKIPNKKKYVDIIQAQMSDNELYINFYNGISNKGKLKFLPLLDEYGLLENIMSRGDIFNQHASVFYPKTNFKNTSNYTSKT